MRKFIVILMLMLIPLALVLGKPTATYPIGDVDDHPYKTTADEDTLVTDTIFVDNTYYSDCIISVWGYEINGDAMATDSLNLYITPYIYSPNRNPDSITLMLNQDTAYLDMIEAADQGCLDTHSLSAYLPYAQAFIIIISTHIDPAADTMYYYPFYTLIERL